MKDAQPPALHLTYEKYAVRVQDSKRLAKRQILSEGAQAPAGGRPDRASIVPELSNHNLLAAIAFAAFLPQKREGTRPVELTHL